ncbi:MAG: rod shape-determining protein MreC [Sphingosinicella sp.]
MTPASRHRGFSRKAQYGLLFGYIIAVLGLLAAVFLIGVAVIDPRGFSAIRGAALDAAKPLNAAGGSVARFFSDLGTSVGDYVQAASENVRLRRELEDTRRALVQMKTIEAQNARLTGLLRLAREASDEVAVARIVGSSYDSPRRLATLSAGSAHGVRVGQPVRSADGLIGRILEAGAWASRVLLVSDGASSVPVRLVRTNLPALAVGRGDGTIELRTLEVGENPFRRGDILVTTGVGGIFPPDVPVARVVRLEGDTGIARPLADPARADRVIVQPIYQPAAAGELAESPRTEPAPPVAAPPVPGEGGTPPVLQRDPRYQPALQRPQPGQRVRR